jgi:hypothetical protein
MLSAVYAAVCCLCSLPKGAMTLSITTLRITIKLGIQHYNTKPNETRHNDTQQNDTKSDETQHIETQHIETQHIETQHIETQHNLTKLYEN